MPRYIGHGDQLAECMRCGEKGLARDLVRDGRNPSLLVFLDCYDPLHPQEEPFMASDSDGMAKHEIAPENLPNTAPVLTSELLSDAIELNWTLANTVGPVIDTYTLYRAEDDGDFDPVASFAVDFGNGIDDLAAVTRVYADEDVQPDTTYTYKIVATAGSSPVVSSFTSNTVNETVPPQVGFTFVAGMRGDFGDSLYGIDAGDTLSSGTQAIGETTSNTTGLNIVKVAEELSSAVPSALAFTILADGLAQDAFASISFGSDIGTAEFLSEDAIFNIATGPNGEYGEWIWASVDPTPYFTDGQSYTVTVT